MKIRTSAAVLLAFSGLHLCHCFHVRSPAAPASRLTGFKLQNSPSSDDKVSVQQATPEELYEAATVCSKGGCSLEAVTDLKSKLDVRKDELMVELAKVENSMKATQKMELSLEKKASSKESAQEMQVEVTKERKNNLLIACSSVLAAVCLFATQRFFPPDSLSLLRAMEAESTPLIAVQTNGKPTVVDFYADWCGYCKTMAPSMRTVEKEFAGRVNFVTVNGADPKNADLVYKFKVDGIPHIAFMDGEGYVETAFVGLVPKDVLEEEVDALAKHKALPYEGYDAFQGRPRSVFPLI